MCIGGLKLETGRTNDTLVPPHPSENYSSITTEPAARRLVETRHTRGMGLRTLPATTTGHHSIKRAEASMGRVLGVQLWMVTDGARSGIDARSKSDTLVHRNERRQEGVDMTGRATHCSVLQLLPLCCAPNAPEIYFQTHLARAREQGRRSVKKGYNPVTAAAIHAAALEDKGITRAAVVCVLLGQTVLCRVCWHMRLQVGLSSKNGTQYRAIYGGISHYTWRDIFACADHVSRKSPNNTRSSKVRDAHNSALNVPYLDISEL